MAHARRSISCPSCGRAIGLSAKAGPGMRIQCPQCGQRSLLQSAPPEPSAGAAPPLPPHPASAPGFTGGSGDMPPHPWAPPPRPKWFDLSSVLIGGLVAAIVGGSVVGAILLRKSRGGAETAGGDPSAASADGSSGAPVPEIAAKAEAVLRANCHRCHGEGGSNEGGFNFVLRREKLIEGGKYVVPGNPAGSRLLQRIQSGDMPMDGEPLKPEDVAVVKAWIEAGAPDFAAAVKREFISPEQMFDYVRTDLLVSTPEPDRLYVRYFTLTHLYNAGLSDDEMETYRLALSKLLNSLSWNRQLVAPKPLDPARTVLRVDLRDLDWTDDVWKKIINADPYALVNPLPAAKQCQDATDCKVPSVRGDWFVSAASRPPLYYDVLQLPADKPMDELQRLLRVDTARNIERRTVARAGFNGSDVSRNNRLIERHRSPYGALWISYDFAANTDRKNLLSHPLGPGTDEKSFDHDGGEVIFNLPNGLQGYLLIDAKGKRLDKGPTTIVTDDRRPDRAVVNGLSCMSCHFGGIIRKDDQVRAHVLANQNAFPDGASILGLYPESSEMKRLQEEDAQRFENASKQIGLSRLTATGEPIVNMALRFESDLDVRLASAELGLPPDKFVALLGSFPNLSRVLGTLKVAGGTMKRDAFVKIFTDAATAFGMGTPYNPKPAKTEVADAGKPADPPKSETPKTETPKLEAPVKPEAPDPYGNGKPGRKAVPIIGTGIVRNWYDQRGRHLAHGELMGLLDGRTVIVKKDNGGTLEYDIDVFSDPDQRIVLNQASEQLPVDLPDGAGTVSEPAPKGGPQIRTWTPLTGDREPFEAQYIGTIGIMVLLKKPDGEMVRGPLAGLSEEDQAFVEELKGAKGRKKPPASGLPQSPPSQGSAPPKAPSGNTPASPPPPGKPPADLPPGEPL